MAAEICLLIPRYHDLSRDEGERLARLNAHAHAIAGQEEIPFEWALREVADDTPEGQDALDNALYIARQKRPANPERREFEQDNPELRVWFGDLPLDYENER